MPDEDEFDDKIDWSTIKLPSISASMGMPWATKNLVGNSSTIATLDGGSRACHHYSSSSGNDNEDELRRQVRFF